MVGAVDADSPGFGGALCSGIAGGVPGRNGAIRDALVADRRIYRAAGRSADRGGFESARAALNPEHASEPSGGVVGLRSVVIDEGSAEPSVAEECSAFGAEFLGRGKPAGGFEIELAEGLEVEVEGFVEEFDADFVSKLLGTVRRRRVFASDAALVVEAETSAALRTLWGAIDNEKLPGCFIAANASGFAAGGFHLGESGEGFGFVEPGFEFAPCHPSVAMRVAVESVVEDSENIDRVGHTRTVA